MKKLGFPYLNLDLMFVFSDHFPMISLRSSDLKKNPQGEPQIFFLQEPPEIQKKNGKMKNEIKF